MTKSQKLIQKAYLIVLCLFIAFSNCSKKQSYSKDEVPSSDYEKSKSDVSQMHKDSLKVQGVKGENMKAIQVEMHDFKVFKPGIPKGYEKKVVRAPVLADSLIVEKGKVVYNIDPESDLYKLINLTDEQFDSIPELKTPLKMIVKERTLLYLWPPKISKIRLSKDGIVRALKKYKNYLFIKRTGGALTGWVEQDKLKKSLHQNVEFNLEFVIGDSTGSGVLNSPVRVSSDREGNFYILDVDRNFEYRIQKYSAEGDFIKFIELPIIKEKNKRFMKIKDDYIFIPIEGGIGKFTLDGRKIDEIKEGLVRPIALDIAPNGDIFILDDETPPRMGVRDIFIKIYSQEGKLLKSLIPKDLKALKDIKVKDNKIYIVGNKGKTDKNEVFTIRDTIPLYSEGGFMIKKINKGELLKFIEGYKKINKKTYKKAITQKNDTGFVNIESKDYIPNDVNAVYILDKDGNKLGEVTSKNIALGSNVEMSKEMARGRHTYYYIWRRITVDENGNLYVLLYADLMNAWGFRLIKFDKEGNIYPEILYSDESWIYTGSSRNFKVGASDTDLEYCKDSSVLLIDNYELFRIYNSKIQKVIKDVPNEVVFDNPTGIEVDKEGYIFVSDITLNKIKKYSPSGELIWSIGEYGKENGKFYCVGDLAVDDEGYIYAADNGNNRLQKFDSDGKFILSFSVSVAPISTSGSSFDVTVFGENLKLNSVKDIHIFSKNGELIEKYKSNLRLEIGSTFDKDNNLWTFKNTEAGPIIRVFNKEGEVIDGFTLDDFKGKPNRISDLKFDSQGNLWIVDPGSYQVKKYKIKWN